MAKKQKHSDELKTEMIHKFLEYIEYPQDKITGKVILKFMDYNYRTIVRPLIIQDYYQNNLSLGKLAIRYRLTKRQVQWIVENVN